MKTVIDGDINGVKSEINAVKDAGVNLETAVARLGVVVQKIVNDLIITEQTLEITSQE